MICLLEYDEHQRLNEHERKLVAADIRIAKRVQTREDQRAKDRGILLDSEKKEIANRDMEIAEDVQNAEVARFVDLKERENSGEQLANKLFAEEQDEFRRAEEEVIRREKRARRDAEKASRLQEEEIANYKGLITIYTISRTTLVGPSIVSF